MTIHKLDIIDRPASRALLTAIEDVIDQFAEGALTPIEILGTLDFASKQFYQKAFIGDNNEWVQEQW